MEQNTRTRSLQLTLVWRTECSQLWPFHGQSTKIRAIEGQTNMNWSHIFVPMPYSGLYNVHWCQADRMTALFHYTKAGSDFGIGLDLFDRGNKNFSIMIAQIPPVSPSRLRQWSFWRFFTSSILIFCSWWLRHNCDTTVITKCLDCRQKVTYYWRRQNHARKRSF